MELTRSASTMKRESTIVNKSQPRPTSVVKILALAEVVAVLRLTEKEQLSFTQLDLQRGPCRVSPRAAETSVASGTSSGSKAPSGSWAMFVSGMASSSRSPVPWM